MTQTFRLSIPGATGSRKQIVLAVSLSTTRTICFVADEDQPAETD